MGMYTTVRVPQADGTTIDVQFKGGGDNCDTYNLGDALPQKIFPEAGRGYFLDGVEEGIGPGVHGDDWWVVISQGKLVHAERWHKPADWDGNPDEEQPWHVQRLILADLHGVTLTPPRGLWGEEAWAEKERQDAERDAAYLRRVKDFLKPRHPDMDIESMTLEQISSTFDPISLFTQLKMREPSMFSKIMPPVAVPNG